MTSPVTLEAGAPQPRRLRTDVLLMLGAKGVAMVLNVASTVIIARALGASGRGVAAVAFNLTLLLVQIGTFGIVTANPYFVARNPAGRDRVVVNALWLAALLGGVCVAIAVALRELAPEVTRGLDGLELGVSIAGIPAALAALFLQSVLLGEGRTVAMNLIEVVTGIGAVTALAIVVVGFDAGVLGAISVTTGSYVATAAIFAATVRPRRAAGSSRLPDVRLGREMLKYGFRIYVATLVGFLVLRLDLLLVNAYLGERQAGLYSVVAALAQGMYVIPSVVGINLFPRVARGADDEVSAGIFRSFFLLYGAFCLFTMALAPVAIRVLYGAEFDGSVVLYWWLAPGIFALGMLTVLSHHFAGRGFPLEAMLVWFVGLAVNVGLNVTLLRAHGTWIASMASSVAYTVLLMLHVRMFARDAGGYRMLRPSPRETVRFVRVALSRGTG